MSDDIKSWLGRFDLGKYADAFAENAIDFRALPRLTEDDLKELGLPLGARRNLQAAIEQLSDEDTNLNAAAQPTESTLTGEAERRQLTVMFCDLVGSTELSQQLDPEDLRDVNRAYQDACKGAIERFEGYVARYMGDGVLAYFGYPQAHEDDAERAVRAGLGLVQVMERLNASVGKQNEVDLAVRVGIATGPVVVGDLIGEGASQESAVVGETPNLAARLQGLASPNAVVIGPGTHGLVTGRFEYENLGERELKGMAEPVRAWRVIALTTAESRFEAAHRTGLTPLVGREHEIGLLLERWEQTKEGDGQVVCLSGEPGIGKSRVSETLREHTTRDNPIRLRYQCSGYHTNSALHPFIEQIERAAGFEKEDSANVRLKKLETLLSQGTPNVETVAPLFASLLSIPAEDHYAPLEMSPERQKDATLEALISQLEGLSRNRPVLLLFEDVHWADPTSLECLGLIVGRMQSLPLLAVITFRPEFSPPWSGHSHVTSLVLNRFSRGLVTAMIDRVTMGKPLPEEVRDQIIVKTDGVPLFVEELTQTVIESGLLEDRGNHYGLAGPLPDLAIPSTLHDSLLARLDRLAAPVREVAQIASVIGREFSYEVLKAVSPLAPNELQDALAMLIETTLVFRQGAPAEGRYVFKHALVRDVAYESLLKSKRRALHGHIAKALETEFSETVATEPEVLAHHYTEAGITESALEYWLRAGRGAGEHGAYAEAVSHLKRGLALLETLPESRARAQAEINYRVALGVPLLSGEGATSPEVAKNYSRAQTLCEEVGERKKLFSVVWGLWYHHMMRSDLRRACGLANRLLEVAREQNDKGLLLEAHHCQWASRLLVGDLSAALEHSEQGIKLYRADEHHALTFTFAGHDPGVCARDQSALALWLSGYPERARKRFEEAIGLARELGHSGTLKKQLVFAIALSTFQRDGHALEHQADALRDFSLVGQVEDRQSMVDGARGWAMFEQGQCEAGLALMRESVKAGLGRDPWHIELISLVAAALGHHGAVKEGLELVDETLRRYQHDDVHWWDAELYRVRGELLLVSSDTNGAEDCFRRAIEIARHQGAKSLELRTAINLTQLWISQGNQQAARELLAPIYDWFTEGFDTPELQEAKALLEQLS